MTIIVDAGIPYPSEIFGPFGEVVTLPAGNITSDRIRTADVLIVRSITRVDASLLNGSSIRFVGSATIGTDHVDLAFLEDNEIRFEYAPGCNAQAVVEYVLAALSAVSADKKEDLSPKTVGIVGYGAIGSRLATYLEGLGIRTLRCDPPRADRGEKGFISFQDLAEQSDIVTLHCPLSRTGDHPTHHFINSESLSYFKPGAWLINSARGAIVDGEALSHAIDAGRIGAAVLDVWENEPLPDPSLIHRCDIATPHIAGYSWQGKMNGARMIAAALADWLGEKFSASPADEPAFIPANNTLSPMEWLQAHIDPIYDIRVDDRALRSIVTLPPVHRAAAFHSYRETYPYRASLSGIDQEWPG